MRDADTAARPCICILAGAARLWPSQRPPVRFRRTPGSAAKPAGGTKRFLGLTRVSPEAPSSVSLALRKGFEVPPSSSLQSELRVNPRSRTARPVRFRREAEEDWTRASGLRWLVHELAFLKRQSLATQSGPAWPDQPGRRIFSGRRRDEFGLTKVR